MFCFGISLGYKKYLCVSINGKYLMTDEIKDIMDAVEFDTSRLLNRNIFISQDNIKIELKDNSDNFLILSVRRFIRNMELYGQNNNI